MNIKSSSPRLVGYARVSERRLIQERTNAGLAAARARGRFGGRKPMPVDDPRVQAAKKMHCDRSMPVMDICKTLRVSRATLYRYVGMKSSGVKIEST